MNRSALSTACKLLTKAQSTEFDQEAKSLVEKSYRLLATVVASFDEEPAPVRCLPGERRLVRATRPRCRSTAIGHVVPMADPGVAYHRQGTDPTTTTIEHFDLSA
jgi:hypothetical protein